MTFSMAARPPCLPALEAFTQYINHLYLTIKFELVFSESQLHDSRILKQNELSNLFICTAIWTAAFPKMLCHLIFIEIELGKMPPDTFHWRFMFRN